MRVVILGNSGSGKSTLAAELAREHDLPRLELDSIFWEPHQIAVARPLAAIHADLAQFLAGHDRWVIEGCYGDLAERVLPAATELVFLDPGVDACVANNRRRPWEPHKYDSPDDQERMLPVLLEWVEGYYTRDDRCSHARHRRIFDDFTGPKRRSS